MLRTLSDKLYGKGSAIKWFKSKNPGEEVVFASAATILETKENISTGWSLRRLFQHRGVVMVAQNQIALKDCLFSVSTVVFSFFFIISVMAFLQSQDWSSILAVIVLGIYIFQRFPYQQQILLKDVQKIETSEVSGITGKYSLLTIYLKDKTVNIVPAQILKKDIIELITSRAK